MKKKIYIGRHGQNEDNAKGILNGHRDFPLTDVGVKQTYQMGHHIKDSGLRFDKIFSSPLQRAYKTGEIAAEILGMEKPEKLDLLIERDFGIMTGKPVADIEKICGVDGIIKTDTITYFIAPEGAETFPQLYERGKRVLEFLENEVGHENILLTCHGDIGKMIYAAFYNENWKDILINFHFGNCELLLLDHDHPADKRHLLKLEQFNH